MHGDPVASDSPARRVSLYASGAIQLPRGFFLFSSLTSSSLFQTCRLAAPNRLPSKTASFENFRWRACSWQRSRLSSADGSYQRSWLRCHGLYRWPLWGCLTVQQTWRLPSDCALGRCHCGCLGCIWRPWGLCLHSSSFCQDRWCCSSPR